MPRISIIALPVLIASLLFAACGGGDDGDNGDTTSTATATATASDGTATASPNSTESSGSGSGNDSGATGGEVTDFAALAANFANARFTATYQVSGTSDGEPVDGEWRWYQDGPDRMRMDFNADGEEGTMISTTEGLLICAEGACFGLPAGAEDALPDLTSQLDGLQDEALSGEVRSAGSREIAGTTAECYEFEDNAEGASGLVCYADGGIPLLMESNGDGTTFRMEATEFRAGVSDEDFEAPFPVSALPTGN